MQFWDGMYPPGSAASPGRTANNATALALPIQLVAVSIQHIHIKEPPQRGGFFNFYTKGFQRVGIHIHSKIAFTTGVFAEDLFG